MNTADMPGGPAVEVRGLSVAYGQRDRVRTVLHELDLDIAPGETIALVGESGSGKTTSANALIGLLPGSGAITSGQIRVLGDDVTHARERWLRAIRGSVIGLVPQDPMVALNPTRRVGASEALAHIVCPASRRPEPADLPADFPALPAPGARGRA
jgi:peptide/nickel transport system ATP-binding protein